jgi:rubrerythrin
MKQKVDFKESKTLQNLARSFASETMEGAKYQFLAQKCEEEKLCYLQTIFKTLAKHEMSHAKIIWNLIHDNYGEEPIENINMTFGYPFDCNELCESINCTKENESYLSTNIYPEFAKIAKMEGYPEIEHTFKLIATVENCHSELLCQIYDKFKNGKLYKSTSAIKWKCNQCGFEHTAKQPLDPCPLCGAEKGNYEVPINMGE